MAPLAERSRCCPDETDDRIICQSRSRSVSIFMDIVRIIFPILVGAVIGYFTNYIAIRMLFHPYKAVRIGKWKLPFTPGIIPKNQSRVANAVGTAVSEQLLTKEVITGSIRKSGSGKQLITQLSTAVCESEKTLSEFLPDGQAREEVLDALSDFLSRSIMEKISTMDMTTMVAQIGKESMESLISNRPFIAMFLNENTQYMIYEKLGETAKDYLDRNGEEAIRKFVSEYLREMGDQPLRELIASGGKKDRIQSLLAEMMEQAAVRHGESLLDQINVKEITRQRIEEMQVDEVEKLVLSVMKHELQAVINLGALIGAVIGTINILF